VAIIQRVRTVLTGVAGSPWYSNLYCAGSTSDASLEIDAIGEFWDAVSAVMHTSVTWRVEGIVANVNDATGSIVSTSSNSDYTGAGLDTGDLLPIATQGLLQMRTGIYVGGREIRGRLFVPGAVEDSSTAGKPGTVFRDTVQAAFDDKLSTSGQLNGELVIYSPTYGTSEQVTNASVWSDWAVLRSRRN
jgi:hypothetical protein